MATLTSEDERYLRLAAAFNQNIAKLHGDLGQLEMYPTQRFAQVKLMCREFDKDFKVCLNKWMKIREVAEKIEKTTGRY